MHVSDFMWFLILVILNIFKNNTPPPQFLSCYLFSVRVQKSVDPDQMASSELQKPVDLDLQCFIKMICPGSAWQGLNVHRLR